MSRKLARLAINVPGMLVNELTDLRCEACGEEVDVLDAGFDSVLPLLCPECELLLLDEARLEVAAAA